MHEPGSFEAADVVIRDALAASHHELQWLWRRRADARKPTERSQRRATRANTP